MLLTLSNGAGIKKNKDKKVKEKIDLLIKHGNLKIFARASGWLNV